MKNSNSWYNKTILVVLSLIFFFPVGLYALWKNERATKALKIIVTIFFSLFIIVSINSDPTPENFNIKEGKENTTSLDVNSTKINNLYNRALSELKENNISKANNLINELSLEPGGLDKSLDLSDKLKSNAKAISDKLNNELVQLKKYYYTDYDKFKKITWYYPISERNNYKTSIYCYFGASNEDIYNLRFKIRYYGDSWIFWEKAIFLCDGETYDYYPKEGTSTNSTDSVWETSDEEVDTFEKIVLENIINSKKVSFRLDGKSGISDNNLSISKIKSIKNIMRLHEILSSQVEINKIINNK